MNFELPSGSMRCGTGIGDVSFFVVKAPQSQTTSEEVTLLQISHVRGIGILTHSVVALKGIKWDLAKNDADQLVVIEENANINQVLPMMGLRKGLFMEVKYNTGRAVQINIYRNNHIISSNLVTHCQ